MKINKLIPICIALFTSVHTKAQLVTTSGGGPTQLVQNVLIGNGISASNIQYQGSSNAIGYFDGTGCNIGLDEGIILTTGTVYNTSTTFGGPQGPHGPNNASSAGVDVGGSGLQSLTNIAGETTYDAVLLEFDFVPLNDTVQFNYVFASEEYPEYVNAGYNDVFAFFISGPGINGSYNMAQIPGTSTPVTIDNINDNTNSSYYVSNGDGSTSPYDSDDYYVQYDGFTIPMTALAEVECGKTYHLQIALADVGDGQYDSGIFLEAGSFSTPTVIDVQNITPTTMSNNQTDVSEGCDEIILEFTRYGNVSDAMDINISVSGSATEGTDYSNVPPVVSFGPGQTTTQIQLDVFYDGITEGDENIVIQLDVPDPCDNTSMKTFEFVIKNIEPISVTLDNQQLNCSGETVTLAPQVQGGSSFTYEWNTGATTPTIDVNPNATENFWVKVTDDCTGDVAQANATVDVPIYPPIDLNASSDTTVTCPLSPVQLFAEANGGAGNFTYEWSDGQNTWSGPVHIFSPFSSTTYTVKVTDGCGEVDSLSVTIHVDGTPMEVIPQPNVRICPGDTAVITADARYGRPQYTYHWLHDNSTNPTIVVSPQYTTEYVVEIRDSCDTYSVYDTIKVKVVRPDANFSILSSTLYQGLPISFGNFTTGGNYYYWDFGNGEQSQEFAPNTIYEDPGDYMIELIAENDLGCMDTTYRLIKILPEFYLYVPNAFTPDGNRHNNYFEVSLINGYDFEIKIFNRWGELLFISNDSNFQWDGRYKGEFVPDGVYVYQLKVTSIHGELIEKYGTVTVLR